MATIATLAVNILGNVGGLKSALGQAQSDIRATAKSLQEMGRGMQDAGGKMTAAITLPLVGAGAAAIRFGVELNEGMANVASLGVAETRVTELKTSVQDLAIETGKSTTDLAGGLYQVISAFGDTADTANILGINAKAAAAGLATTTDAINLTSAVTKGYGDTSATAVQHVSDLAFTAVQLGQTTFPELAASMGSVVPLASSLGVNMETLFATMATATGVTGNTSEVSTQLRGVLQSLMAPTENMTALQQKMGFTSGEAMLKALGLQGTIKAVTDAASASGAPLQSYIGSIEGQTLALALSGPLADQYAQKLSAMNDVAGASEAAFAAQTQGINKAGFAMQQARTKMEVFFQRIYDGMGPAVLTLTDLVGPLIDKLLGLANRFQSLSPVTQRWIVGIAAAAAAIGPLLVGAGMLVSFMGSALPVLAALGGAFSVLLGPIGLVAAALVAAFAFDVAGIRTGLLSVLGSLQQRLVALSTINFGGVFGELVAQFTNIGIETYDTTDNVREFLGALGLAPATVDEIDNAIRGLAENVYPIFDTIRERWSAVVDAFSTGKTSVGGIFGELVAQITGFGIDTYDTTDNIEEFVLALTGSQETARAVGDAVFNLGTRTQELGTWFQTAWGQVQTAVSSAWSAVQPTLNQLWGWLQIMLPIAVSTLQGWFVAAWNGIPGAVSSAWGVIQPTLSQLWTWLQVNIPVALSVLGGWFTAAWSTASGAITSAWTNAGPALQALWGWLQVSIPIALATLQGWFTTAWSAASGAVTTASDLIGTAVSAIQTAWTTLSTFFGPSVERLGQSLGTFSEKILGVGPSFQALWTAAQPILTALQQAVTWLATVIGAGLAVVALTAINLLAATFENLGSVVKAVVDAITATLTFISTGVQEMVGLVQSLIAGDFAGAWTHAQNLVSNAFVWITAVITGGLGIISGLVATIGGTISTTLSDLGFTNLAAAIQTATDKVTGFLGWLGKLVSGQVALEFSMPAWLEQVLAWVWPALPAAPIWLRGLMNWLWPAMGEAVPWLSTLLSWAWPLLASSPVGWLTTLFGWAWPGFPGVPSWVTELFAWDWPAFEAPGWLQGFIDSVTTLFNSPAPGTTPVSGSGGGYPLPVTIGNALGTSYWQGGGTWVGETGREWVSLPRGSQVVPNREAERMGGAVVHIYNPVLREDQDVRLLAAQVAEELDRRRR